MHTFQFKDRDSQCYIRLGLMHHLLVHESTETSSQGQHAVPRVIGFYDKKSPFAEFSNFHYAPFVFHLPEVACNSGWSHVIYCEVAEKAIMLVKAALMEDRDSFEEMITTTDPAAVKQLGREVTNFDQEKWNEHIEAVAFEVVKQKFESSMPLRDLLLSTGEDILAEATQNDSIWGIGMNIDDHRVQDPEQWLGCNILGEALMLVREHLRFTDSEPSAGVKG